MVTKSLSRKGKKKTKKRQPKAGLRVDNMPFYADWSVEFEEDVVACSGGDGPEEVLSQVGLLQSVALVHLWDQRKTQRTYCCIVLILPLEIYLQNESAT